MGAITLAHTGWMNFEPAVYVEDAFPPDAGFFRSSGRAPTVPLATWTPPSAPRRGRAEPAMIGLQHPAGGKAGPFERLGDACLAAEMGGAARRTALDRFSIDRFVDDCDDVLGDATGERRRGFPAQPTADRMKLSTLVT